MFSALKPYKYADLSVFASDYQKKSDGIPETEKRCLLSFALAAKPD